MLLAEAKQLMRNIKIRYDYRKFSKTIHRGKTGQSERKELSEVDVNITNNELLGAVEWETGL